jgi:hypothetical protein
VDYLLQMFGKRPIQVSMGMEAAEDGLKDEEGG